MEVSQPSLILVDRTVLNGFGQVWHPDVGRTIEIGSGPRDFQDAMIRSRTEMVEDDRKIFLRSPKQGEREYGLIYHIKDDKGNLQVAEARVVIEGNQ